MRPYKCIFFDLDHTLWDYETNSCATLQELFESHGLQNCGIPDCESFQQQFTKINHELWELYDRGLISSEVIRKERFKKIFEHFNVADHTLCEKLSADYIHNCPKKGHLVPNALETLQYLAAHYVMTVVTNGFDDTQYIKLSAGNLHPYFAHIVTSQKAGHRKPSREIFEYAMKMNNISADEVIMVGDNLITDIGGAHNACIDPVFYNPGKITHGVKVKYEISNLSALKDIL